VRKDGKERFSNLVPIRTLATQRILEMDNEAPIISQVIHPEAVDLHLEGITNKEELIRHLSHLLYKVGKIESVDTFVEAVYEREDMGPTYMSDFIAFPHGKSDSVVSAGVALGRSREGIYYESGNGGGLAKIILLIALPEDIESAAYINILKNLARLLVREEFRAALYAAESYEDVVAAVQRGEVSLAEEQRSRKMGR
jgi:PTS system fructose-specific IIA component